MRVIDDVRWDIRRDAYDEAAACFVDLARSFGIGEDKIGFFGEVGFPGVSDIDALVIGDAEKLSRLRVRHQEVVGRSSAYGYLFWHEPLWVLNEVVHDMGALHTLEGLKLLAGPLEATGINRPPVARGAVLDVAWLIFLLGMIAESARLGLRRTGVGMRLLLLLHKNLCHSINVFGGVDILRRDGLMQAAELRQLTKDQCARGEVDRAGETLWRQVLGAVNTACREMDQVCAPMGEGVPANHGASWLITRSICFRRGDHTMFDPASGCIVLGAYPFVVAKAWLHGHSVLPEAESYAQAVARCRRAYKGTGLEYPFISLVPVAAAGWKRAFTVGVNRLADAFSTVF